MPTPMCHSETLEFDSCHVTYTALLFDLIFTSGHVFCWLGSRNIPAFPEDGPLRAETCSSVTVWTEWCYRILVGFFTVWIEWCYHLLVEFFTVWTEWCYHLLVEFFTVWTEWCYHILVGFFKVWTEWCYHILVGFFTVWTEWCYHILVGFFKVWTEWCYHILVGFFTVWTEWCYHILVGFFMFKTSLLYVSSASPSPVRRSPTLSSLSTPQSHLMLITPFNVKPSTTNRTPAGPVRSPSQICIQLEQH